MTHTSAQALLYDYLRKDLEPGQRRRLEEHLATCKRCTHELAELRSITEAMPPHSIDAAGERDEEFWKAFPSRIEGRLSQDLIKTTQTKKRPSWPIFFPPFSAHPRLIPALGGILAVVAIATLAWQLRSPVKPDTDQSAILQPIFDGASDRLAEYFRKSKVLLVGLTNMNAPEGEPLDLSVERQRSEELLLAGRTIPRDSLDGYSAMVADDLERVLVEITATQSASERKQVELVRDAIRQQNLIFKLRMIEKMHAPPRTMTIRDEAR
jgi:anti-sigma factor RsiW